MVSVLALRTDVSVRGLPARIDVADVAADGAGFRYGRLRRCGCASRVGRREVGGG